MEQLKKLTAFVQNVTDVSHEDIKAFAAKSTTRTYRKKEYVVSEGDICKHLLFIHQGVFRYYVLHDGNEWTKDFAVDSSNPFCTAFTSFMTQSPSQIYIEALEDSSVWIWNETIVSSLFQQHPGWMAFAKKMAESLYFRKERRELSFLRDSAEEKYIQFLSDFPSLVQRVPQYMIASYLGITPESLSRVRSRIARKPRATI